jgi:hypothetical protein
MLLQFLGPADGILIIGVSSVNDHITAREMREELMNSFIHRVTGRNMSQTARGGLSFLTSAGKNRLL